MNIEQMESLPPGIIPNASASGVSSKDFRVKVFIANLNDTTEVLELEKILTEGLDGKSILVIDRDKYSFQQNYYVVITYLEKR